MSSVRITRGCSNLIAAAGGREFLENFFNDFSSFASALLNAAEQFLLLAFDELEVVVCELRPLLFQFALGNVPVAFDFEFVHCRLGLDLMRHRPPEEVLAGLMCRLKLQLRADLLLWGVTRLNEGEGCLFLPQKGSELSGDSYNWSPLIRVPAVFSTTAKSATAAPAQVRRSRQQNAVQNLHPLVRTHES